MAKEYIERGAAYNAIVNNYTTDEQLRDLDAIPTADVVPVRYGRWINPHWQGSAHCMNCNQCKYEAQHTVYHGVEKYYHYCPNCGALMDKDGEENG